MNDAEYGPNRKYGIAFGSGNFIRRDDLTKLPEDQIRTLALKLGWANGCPVVRELSDPSNTQFGPLSMAQRYNETNRWFKFISSYYERPTRSISSSLRVPILRHPDEPVGKHEPKSVPMLHLTQISPMSRIHGYALPRVFIELLSLRRHGSYPVDFIHNAIARSSNPDTLLSKLSLSVVAKGGVEPVSVLQHLFPAGLLAEENCRRAYISLAESLNHFAPDLVDEYLGLSTSEKANLEIADIPS